MQRPRREVRLVELRGNNGVSFFLGAGCVFADWDEVCDSLDRRLVDDDDDES